MDFVVGWGLDNGVGWIFCTKNNRETEQSKIHLTVASTKNIFEIEGFDKFLREVEKLPDRMKRNELLKVLRRSSKPTIQAAKRNIHSRSNRLGKSIGNITGKNREYPNVMVGPRVKGKNEGFHGHLVEFGHGGPHPAPANPFMRPAYDETKNRVSDDLAKKISAYLEKQANKLSHGK